MANAGLSAKQEKYDKIQKLKQEVYEMVKSRTLKRTVDPLALKISILIVILISSHSLEEDSGPPVEKLYEEVVERYIL
ncbi:hypothetical protein SASPL_133680 [Salvia splendens]|uniref:Uncharacterized protein n=1 Tax=Salvia splendens TaxID=180675 RepID=A0A8X8X5I7_SALSN|nr:hypothetical protein SASPL_133680 [Salvia splendens]